MIQIAICDYSQSERKMLRRMLECYFAKQSQALSIQEYRNGQTLRDDYADGMGLYQLIFLETCLPDFRGMDVARAIRSYDTDVKIIFYAENDKYAIESYEVSAFYYLVKPVEPQKLYTVLDRFLICLDREERQSLFVKSGRLTRRISYRDILYIESKNSCAIIHTRSKEEFLLYRKLTEIERELGKAPFLRCHQSYIVNLNYIRSVHKSFILEDGTEIPIRRQDAKELKEHYFAYIIKTTI